MNPSVTFTRWPGTRRASLIATLLLALPGSAALARPPGHDMEAASRYHREVRACRDGHTAQDPATCLKEARSARAERQHGTPEPASHTDFQANALLRCNPLRGDDKVACQARVLGYGNSSGSVEGGGVLREVETVRIPAGAGLVVLPEPPR